MVFSEQTTETTDSTQTTAESTLKPWETADRIATILEPFLNVITVLVQALTAYTLLKNI